MAATRFGKRSALAAGLVLLAVVAALLLQPTLAQALGGAVASAWVSTMSVLARLLGGVFG